MPAKSSAEQWHAYPAAARTDSRWLQICKKGLVKSTRAFCFLGVRHAKVLFFSQNKILFLAASGMFNLYMYAVSVSCLIVCTCLRGTGLSFN
jgi:hypothetical protein